MKIVIVRDMWLTGFDAPCMATMYVDKPMKGANLAQAIARVNRVFKDKPGGLIVDYIGIAPQLKEALATYTAAQATNQPSTPARRFGSSRSNSRSPRTSFTPSIGADSGRRAKHLN